MVVGTRRTLANHAESKTTVKNVVESRKLLREKRWAQPQRRWSQTVTITRGRQHSHPS